jgi:hypothetical protein
VTRVARLVDSLPGARSPESAKRESQPRVFWSWRSAVAPWRAPVILVADGRRGPDPLIVQSLFNFSTPHHSVRLHC